jgi:hypothetical protein
MKDDDDSYTCTPSGSSVPKEYVIPLNDDSPPAKEFSYRVCHAFVEHFGQARAQADFPRVVLFVPRLRHELVRLQCDNVKISFAESGRLFECSCTFYNADMTDSLKFAVFQF